MIDKNSESLEIQGIITKLMKSGRADDLKAVLDARLRLLEIYEPKKIGFDDDLTDLVKWSYDR